MTELEHILFVISTRFQESKAGKSDAPKRSAPSIKTLATSKVSPYSMERLQDLKSGLARGSLGQMVYHGLLDDPWRVYQFPTSTSQIERASSPLTSPRAVTVRERSDSPEMERRYGIVGKAAMAGGVIGGGLGHILSTRYRDKFPKLGKVGGLAGVWLGAKAASLFAHAGAIASDPRHALNITDKEHGLIGPALAGNPLTSVQVRRISKAVNSVNRKNPDYHYQAKVY